MHFIVTFAFSVPLKSREKVTSDKDTITSRVKGKTGSSRRKKKEINENVSLSKEHGGNVINVGQAVTEFHVEYNLLPSYTFKFDCSCWDTAAKIYTENGDKCLRTVPCYIRENSVWIVFSVHHTVQLNQAQQRKLFSHTINYQIFHGRTKFSERAKKDKVKRFYIDEKSTNNGEYDFLEIFPFDLYGADIPSALTTPRIPEPTIIKDETEGDFSIVSYLEPVPDPVHGHKFRKMLKKQSFPSEPLKVELFNTSDKTKQKSISTKSEKFTRKSRSVSSKSKIKDRKKVVSYAVTVPAEELFAEMGTITRYDSAPEIPGVSSILIYVQCEDILSSRQLRMDLNPLSIKLEKLENFPTDIIHNDFSCLYAKIIFMDRTIVTPYYNLDRIIRFKYIKSFLHDEFPSERLINSLVTEPLIVQIVGIKNLNGIDENVLKFIPKESDNDTSKSRKLPKTSESSSSRRNEVLLGVAMFDLSELLRGSWIVNLTNGLCHPRNVYSDNIDESSGAISTRKASISKNSPLTSDVLFTFDTSIKLKFRLASDLRATHRRVLRRSDNINRILVVLIDLQLANNIIDETISHNYKVLRHDQSLYGISDSKASDTLKDVITGFAIDCHDRFFIFLEGLANGYLLKVWEKTMNLPASSGYVYYNSEYLFQSRLYEEFISLGGLLKVKLSDTLDEQLRNCDLYVGKTRGTPHANMLRTIGLMKLTWTMRSLCQTRLFLDPDAIRATANKIHETYFEISTKDTNEGQIKETFT